MTADDRPIADQLDAAVRQVQAGDVEAYAEVVRLCAPFLRSWIAVRVPASLDPDEIAHQAFIAAFGRIDEYTPGTRFRGWLATLAHHILLNECRALRRRQANTRAYASQALIDANLRQIESEARGDDDGADQRLTAMRTCLDALRSEARDLVNLRYEQSLSIEAIARRQGRSASAIAKSLCLIRRALHHCIGLRSGRQVDA